jgi:glycerol-3-phosphate dehydrogenase
MANARQTAIDDIASKPLDVLIVGGGINGAGIARDLGLRAHSSSRQLRIAIVDRAHFASGTSGRNSQLIHGGLRYLKYFEFKLVSEALSERATLLHIAPHLVEPLPFLIPMHGPLSAGYYEAGLYLYDLLAGKNRIDRHRRLSARELRRIEPRMRPFFSGARFFDCRVNSARLVLLNVREAVDHGAIAVNYLAVESHRKTPDGTWHVELLDSLSGRRFTASSRTLVNATGAWSREGNLRLVRGSHLVLPRLGNSHNAISYFGRDGRIVFFIPWGRRRALTLIGTTDVDHRAGPDNVNISPEEIAYLRGVAEEVFPGAGSIEPLSAYSSLRPLVRDESASATKTSREHRIWADESGIVHVAGGKYTTYRLMSEEAVDLLARAHFPELAACHVTAAAPILGNTPEAIRQLLAGGHGIEPAIDPEDAREIVQDFGIGAPEIFGALGSNSSSALTAVEAARIAFAVRREYVQRLTDLMFVSTYWGYERRWTLRELDPYARELGSHLGWNDATIQEEIQRLLDSF